MTQPDTNTSAQAVAMLESLSDGWEWSLSKYGKWYHCVIRNNGLRHEPCYTSQNAKLKADAIIVVQYTYNEYERGENIKGMP